MGRFINFLKDCWLLWKLKGSSSKGLENPKIACIIYCDERKLFIDFGGYNRLSSKEAEVFEYIAAQGNLGHFLSTGIYNRTGKFLPDWKFKYFPNACESST